MAPLVARLKPGVTFEAARADITSIVRRVHDRPAGVGGSDAPAGVEVTVEPLRSALLSPLTGVARLTVLGAALLVALSTANLAMLLVVHHGTRRREAAIQTALGASTSSLILTPVVEAVVLAGAGVALGLVTAIALHHVVTGVLPGHLRALAVPIADARVLVATILIVLVAAIAGGLPAAWYRRRADATGLLRMSAARTTRSHAAWRTALVITQVAVTTAFVGGGVIAVRNYLAAATSLGYEPRGLGPDLRPVRNDAARCRSCSGDSRPHPVRPRRRGRRGHAAGRAACDQLRRGILDHERHQGRRMGRVGRDVRRDAGAPPCRSIHHRLSVESGAPVLVLNGRGLVALFPSVAPKDAIGLHLDTPHGARTIVGIIEDIKPLGQTTGAPGLYVPLGDPLTPSTGSDASFLVRSRRADAFDRAQTYAFEATGAGSVAPGRAASREPLLARVTASLEARFGAGSLMSSPISPRTEAFVQGPRFLLMLLLGLGITSMVISTMAVFVMTTIAAGLRRHEIAVRAAMGASLAHVVRLFSRSELGTCLVGLLVGLPMACWFGRLLQAFVIEAPATSHAGYVLAAFVVLAAIVAAAGQSLLRFHRRLRRTIQHELAGNSER
jgi:hypothetical protein